MAALRTRHNQWQAKVRIPEKLKAEYGGRAYLYRTITSADRRTAKTEADAWEALLRVEWAEKLGSAGPTSTALRLAYERLRMAAEGGEFTKEERGVDEDTALLGIEHELGKIADNVGPDAEPTPMEAARVAALQDAAVSLRGRRPAPRPEYEAAFSAVATDFIKQWKAAEHRKPSNTEQQKQATFDLFASYWQDRPMRGIRQQDASAFHDALRLLDPSWARTEASRGLSWSQLQARFGGKENGLSQATINRHMAALKSLWEWASKRGYCNGDNPFDGFFRKIRTGKNAFPYVAWETEELNKLLTPLPARNDLTELILVGMHSAMRLDEIASMTWGQLRKADGVPYFDITDAKTEAGKRQVPVHAALSWLLQRPRGSDDARIWPGWNLEGPGKRAGADASRDFSRHKTLRGFPDRRKVFHSFRKNVTRMMEQSGVHESEWAQVFGHERGFTFSTYNPDGITMKHKARLIAKISYPGVALPKVAA